MTLCAKCGKAESQHYGGFCHQVGDKRPLRSHIADRFQPAEPPSQLDDLPDEPLHVEPFTVAQPSEPEEREAACRWCGKPPTHASHVAGKAKRGCDYDARPAAPEQGDWVSESVRATEQGLRELDGGNSVTLEELEAEMEDQPEAPACEHAELHDDVVMSLVQRNGVWRCHRCGQRFKFIEADALEAVKDWATWALDVEAFLKDGLPESFDLYLQSIQESRKALERLEGGE